MKRTLALGMLTALLAAACATTSPPEERKVAANAAGQKTDVACVNETGSRIKQKPGECISNGRTYSQEELERTGSIDTAEALRRLDPSIQ
jgi:hypothetical protein